MPEGAVTVPSPLAAEPGRQAAKGPGSTHMGTEALGRLRLSVPCAWVHGIQLRTGQMSDLYKNLEAEGSYSLNVLTKHLLFILVSHSKKGRWERKVSTKSGWRAGGL